MRRRATAGTSDRVGELALNIYPGFEKMRRSATMRSVPTSAEYDSVRSGGNECVLKIKTKKKKKITRRTFPAKGFKDSRREQLVGVDVRESRERQNECRLYSKKG